MEASDRVLSGHSTALPWSAWIGVRGGDQLKPHAVRILERQHSVTQPLRGPLGRHIVGLEPLGPTPVWKSMLRWASLPIAVTWWIPGGAAVTPFYQSWPESKSLDEPKSSCWLTSSSWT